MGAAVAIMMHLRCCRSRGASALDRRSESPGTQASGARSHEPWDLAPGLRARLSPVRDAPRLRFATQTGRAKPINPASTVLRYTTTDQPMRRRASGIRGDGDHNELRPGTGGGITVMCRKCVPAVKSGTPASSGYELPTLRPPIFRQPPGVAAFHVI